MKTIKLLFIAGSIALLPHLALATPPAGHDSVVQIVAEAQGLAGGGGGLAIFAQSVAGFDGPSYVDDTKGALESDFRLNLQPDQ
jgi:hypothetical protein